MNDAERAYLRTKRQERSLMESEICQQYGNERTRQHEVNILLRSSPLDLNDDDDDGEASTDSRGQRLTDKTR